MLHLKALPALLSGLAAAVLVTFGTPSPAARAWLDGTELAERFGGATIDGRYASGKAFTERYDHDGHLTYTEHSRRWAVTGRSPRARCARSTMAMRREAATGSLAWRRTVMNSISCRGPKTRRPDRSTEFRAGRRVAPCKANRVPARISRASRPGVADDYAASVLSSASMARPISLVPTCCMPGCMMSPVRRPLSRTRGDGLVDDIGFLAQVEGIAQRHRQTTRSSRSGWRGPCRRYREPSRARARRAPCAGRSSDRGAE